MEIGEIAGGIGRLSQSQKRLTERVDYLTVAVMRGDPRFAKPEYCVAGFDSEAFDRDWERRGKRVPTEQEIFDGN